MRRGVVQGPDELGLEGLAGVTTCNRISSHGDTSIGSSPVVAISPILWPPTSLGPLLLEGVVLNGLSESHPFSADAHTQRLKRQKIEGGYGTTSVTPRLIGAADRIRTGDVQLGKLAFCH